MPRGRRLAHRVHITARTLLISALGGLAFHLVGLPAPWISGGMVAVAATTLWGLDVMVPRPIREIMFFVLGLIIGATLTPEALAGIGAWPASLVLLCLTIPVLVASAAAVLIRFRGWSRDDAVLATAPGALSLVLAVADAIGANVGRVAVVQTLRLAILVVVLPPLVVLFAEAGPAPEPIQMTARLDLGELAMLTMAGLAGIVFAWLVRLPLPTLLGAMIGSGVLYATGTAALPIPDAVLVPGLIAMGALVGARFAGMTLGAIASGLVDGLIAFVIAFAVSIAFAVLAAGLLGFAFGQTMLAFAPGGFEVMTVLALALGLDAAYVAVHQTVRFMVLALFTPIFFRTRDPGT